MVTRSLYEINNLTTERDACGIGFVADVEGRPSRRVLDLILAALKRVRHRGAVNADRLTGDGAGVLIPLSPALAPHGGLAMVFLYDEAALSTIENACAEEGVGFAGWREVPVEPAKPTPSLEPSEYTLAVSKVVMPASIAC